ncbi:MAG: hypothetical protein S0880_19480 [Actinomycetota bacterium]|nr:hypothetical protein [Actinomycetota bacterium]
MKPTVVEMGFEVLRADEVARPGAITSQIISLIAEADLVVADLTDLNPNVFYELGVRHTLKGRGTVMLVDTTRNDSLPFDLQAYRVIQYSPDLRGIENLRKTVQQAAAETQSEAATSSPLGRDNPVHDCLTLNNRGGRLRYS